MVGLIISSCSDLKQGDTGIHHLQHQPQGPYAIGELRDSQKKYV